MLLVIDVGNTNTKVGLCDDAGLRVSWTLTTRREQTADEYGLFIEALLRSNGIEAREVTAVAIANVVPPVQYALDRMSEKYFKATPLSVTGASMCEGPSTNEARVGWLRNPLAQVMSGRPGPYLR